MSNKLTGITAKETVRESNGVREVIREVTHGFRQLSVGEFVHKQTCTEILPQ